MSKLLDLLRHTIQREREGSETRMDTGDSTFAGDDGVASPGGAGGPSGAANSSLGLDDDTIPGRRLP
ncbi:MAG TPA: hypothetical protein VIL30_11800 [Ramlibacter sp.]|jgi:hypothetical protein